MAVYNKGTKMIQSQKNGFLPFFFFFKAGSGASGWPVM